MGCLLPPAPAGHTLTVPEQTGEDLQLSRLAAFCSPSDYYRLTAAELNSLFTDDPDVIRERQAVLQDLRDCPALEPALERLLDCLDGWDSRGGSRNRQHDAMAVGFSLEDFSWLDSYLKKLRELQGLFQRIPARSAGVRRLIALLDGLHSSPRCRDVAADFEQLCAGFVSPARMRLGFELDDGLKPQRVKLLQMEPWQGDLGGKKKPEKRRLMLTRRAIEMNGLLLQRAAASASQEINAFVLRETAPLRSLRQDVILCLGARKLMRLWEERGLAYCFPTLCPAEQRIFSTEAMFDPLLPLRDGRMVVPNSLTMEAGGELLLLTGANQGGKTVFLLSVALTQYLSQLGFPVPAASASLSPVKNILTVFAPNGQQFGRRGLLTEEATRIARTVEALTDTSLVLFNEPLTGTGPRETRDLSAEVIALCMAAGARGIWVTHVHELAIHRHRLAKALPWGSKLGSLRVLLDQQNGFTYRVERGEPEGQSHAEEALRRGGVVLSGKP